MEQGQQSMINQQVTAGQGGVGAMFARAKDGLSGLFGQTPTASSGYGGSRRRLRRDRKMRGGYAGVTPLLPGEYNTAPAVTTAPAAAAPVAAAPAAPVSAVTTAPAVAAAPAAPVSAAAPAAPAATTGGSKRRRTKSRSRGSKKSRKSKRSKSKSRQRR